MTESQSATAQPGATRARPARAAASRAIIAQRAIEALRSGVPSTDAVRVLGCAQQQIEVQFQHQLRALGSDGAPTGTLISGGFGSGKSHLLGHLEALALDQGFVVSRVAISKETPLFDLGRVLRSAIDSALAPGTTGRAVQEVALQLNPHSDSYGALQRWAGGASDFLAATLGVFEHPGVNPETRDRIIDYWSGEKLSVAELRSALRQTGLLHAFSGLRNPKASELPLLRFNFAAQLFRAAGYSGWVLLLDEVELIGRYSLLQRARSYAEISRWFGLAGRESVQWMTTVAAITDEFDYAVLHGKQDWQGAGDCLRKKGLLAAAEQAERGMRVIRNQALALKTPLADDIRGLYLALADIYEHAYGWQPGNVFKLVPAQSTPVRTYVRMWITAWDLMRLDPGYVPEIESEAVQVGFGEDVELEGGDETGDEAI